GRGHPKPPRQERSLPMPFTGSKAANRHRQTRLCLEELESRLTPSVLGAPDSLTYQDVDGDLVTVRLSRKVLSGANVNSVFRFEPPGIDSAAPQQLQEIRLDALGPGAAGLSLAVTVAARPGGDDFANVGRIAAGFDLGDVSVQGDLGQID